MRGKKWGMSSLLSVPVYATVLARCHPWATLITTVNLHLHPFLSSPGFPLCWPTGSSACSLGLLNLLPLYISLITVCLDDLFEFCFLTEFHLMFSAYKGPMNTCIEEIQAPKRDLRLPFFPC